MIDIKYVVILLYKSIIFDTKLRCDSKCEKV